MKSKSTNRLLPLVLAATAAIAGPASAADLFWNPAPLDNVWDVTTPNWATTAGGTPNQIWTAGDSANFTAASAYTVTVDGDRTAALTHVAAGTVTLAGSNVISDSVTIDAGAKLITPGTRIAKPGITPIALNGTLDVSEAPSAGGSYFQISGTGTLLGTIRYNGTSEFAGSVVDAGKPTAIVINAGTSSKLTLSGDNSGMSGSILLGLTGGIVNLASANALGVNAFVRFEGAGGTLELAFGDLTRAYAAGSNADGGGGIRFNGGGGSLSAVGADRKFTLVTTPGGTTPADVVWGMNGIEGTVGLATATATNTLTWTNNIDLNGATRTVSVGNGAAEIDALLSGTISGIDASKLAKTGAGVLLLDHPNTYAGGTNINASQGSPNPLRVTNPDALGIGPITIGGGGTNDQSSLEIAGGITLANPFPTFTSRNNDAPNIVNISGNNTITANLSSGGGGNRVTFRSDAGTLNLTGNFNGRTLNLFGEGNGRIAGAVTLALGDPALNGINKLDGGTWTLEGPITNPGYTIVDGGVLSIATATLSDTNAVSIGPNGVLNLTHSATDVVGSLTLDGTVEPDGIYDSTNSGGLITGTGKLQVVTPATGGYTAYANTNGIPGEPATGDFDKDGLANLVEYALGLDPTKSSVPPGTFVNGTLTFTKGSAAIAGGDVNYVIETSTDLGLTDPWTAAVTQNAPDSSTTISYTLPTTGPKRFARLKVVQVP